MRELLDSSTKRRLEILEQLNRSADWLSSNELANTNKASLRTINSDVHYLKENWFPHLIIETSKKNGVRLSTPPSSHASVVYNSVIENSEAFQLLEKIFFDPHTNIEDWEDEMFISESSLYRIANQLTSSLTHYGLNLQKRPCRVSNQNEIYVRYFYTTFFSEVYGIHDWPFALDRRKTVILARDIFVKSGYQVDEVLIMNLAYVIAVSLERISQGFYSEISHPERITKEMRDPFYEFEEQINSLISVLDLSLNDKLLDDLINSIYFVKAIIIDHVDIIALKSKLADFIELIKVALDLEIDDLSRQNIKNVLTFIYLEHLTYPFDDYMLFNRYEFNGTAIRKNFPSFTKVIEKGLETMEEDMAFPWLSTFKNEVIYWVMVKWRRLPTILENKKEKASMLVLSDLGEEHANLLAEMILKNFGTKVKVVAYQESVIFLEDANPAIFEGYDYYVTTFFKDIIPEDKIIVVDAIPSDQDWGKIRRAINKINQIDPALLDYLKKNS